MYIPLGGRERRILNTFIIFSFVALWHDLRLNLLLWAWGIYICLMKKERENQKWEILKKILINKTGMFT